MDYQAYRTRDDAEREIAAAREIHPALFTLLHDWEWDKED